MKNRTLRLFAATTLLAGVGAIAAPHATSYVSSSAVINAPLIILRSPIDGVLMRESAPPSQRLRQGELILEIRQDHPDRSAVFDLAKREEVLTRQIAALKAEEAFLRRLEASILTRQEAHLALEAARTSAQIRQIEAELAAARADLAESEERIERNRRLRDHGTLARSDEGKDAAELSNRRAALQKIEARLDDQRVIQEGIRNGLLTDFDNMSDSQQQLDAIAIRIAELSSRIVTEEADLSGTSERREAELRQLEERSVFAPTAPVEGIIWRASHAPGAKVMTGDEVAQIADCSHRFVEVAISERHFGTIRPGMRAEVILSGHADPFEARVDTVRGSGARIGSQDFAAEIKRPATGQMIVVVSIAPPDPSDGAGTDPSFCDIGRTAEVRFERGILNGVLPDMAALRNLAPWS